MLYRGQKEALKDFLPLDAQNWITCGNALRLDWLSVCPSTGTGVRLLGDDLFSTPLDQPQIDFENEGGETFICGNPPYLGSRYRNKQQQDDLHSVISPHASLFKDLDYVAAWYVKASDLMLHVPQVTAAFVATKSICQGEQVAMLWPIILDRGQEICFAHQAFHWSNLASANAGVTCVIVGISARAPGPKILFEGDAKRVVENIGPYLIPMGNVIVRKEARPISSLARMDYGNKPTDGGNLILSSDEKSELLADFPQAAPLVRAYIGSEEFIGGKRRFCLWIQDDQLELARSISTVNSRLEEVRRLRTESPGQQANANASRPHRFVFAPHRDGVALIIPRVSSERRPYLPAGVVDGDTVISDRAAVIYDPELWLLSIIVSRLHLAWIATVCVRMRMDFSYSNTLGWNTFPVPLLSPANKLELHRTAENILLAREAHFPKTIADLYDPDEMPDNLRRAHEENDEVLERIYIGRRFRNDTERLEKLFDLYTKMIASQPQAKTKKKRSAA